MLLGARQFFERRGAPTPSVPTARDYVQDGLVAMWDGIENAGWGVHDASATVWKDCIDAREAILTQYIWNDNNVRNPNGVVRFCQMPIIVNDILSSDEHTLEFIASVDDSSKRGCFLGQYKNRGTDIEINAGGVSSGEIRYYCSGNPNYFSQIKFSSGIASSVSITRENSETKFYKNGLYSDSFVGSITKPNSNTFYIGSNVEGLGTVGQFYCYRFYSRALTAAEIAANYAIDKARFNLP